MGKIGLEIFFADTLNRKERFLGHTNFFSKSGKNSNFLKGLVHEFGQKLEFFPFFVFGQNRLRNIVLLELLFVFIVDRKGASKDNKMHF